MRFGARASTLLGGLGGVVLAVALTWAPAASAASGSAYPPTGVSCTGPTGDASVGASVVSVGGTSGFSACGFDPGCPVQISSNGTPVGTAVAGADGTVSAPVTFQSTGQKDLSASCGGRTVSGGVLVVAATGASGLTGASGGLPFTGAQTALLVAVAVALVGAGAALLVVSRRRRGTAAS